MTVHDLLLFFIGDAGAIRRLAADPWVLAVGALLVLSAGLARNYDTQDLRRRWWRLLTPFGASAAAAAVLFLVLSLLGRAAVALPLARGLLGLFWLTAPLAWLYGLPFERLWPLDRVARARRLALAVVATCRVALLARCVGVLLGYSWGEGLLIVASFAAPTFCLAVAAALLLPWSEPTASGHWALAGVAGAAHHVRDAMSGVPANLPLTLGVIPPALRDRQPPRAVMPGCALACLAVGVLVLSAWLLPGLIGPPHWPPAANGATSSPPPPGVWAMAVLAVLFWVPLLALRQPAQRRRTVFEQRLGLGDLPQALRDLAALGPKDFPPGWEPAAPLASWWRPAARLLEAAQLAARLPAGSWVRAGFVRGLRQMLPVWADPIELWFSKDGRMTESQLRELSELHDLLRALPEACEVLEPYEEYLAELIDHVCDRDPRRCALLEGLLAVGLKRGSKR
jgi:hypothetical protein